MFLVIFGILAVLAVAAGGIYFYMNTNDQVAENNDTGAAVARVNREEISRSEYERSAAQIAGVYASQGANPNDPQVIASVQDQALNTLINRYLMSDAAADSGITVNDAELETEYQTVVTSLGSVEALNTALRENGMDESDLRSEIRVDLLINKYLESKLQISSIAVTDEEIETAYETAIANNESAEEIPALTDVRDLIGNQLLGEKQQVAINAELERLRQEAEIEVLI